MPVPVEAFIFLINMISVLVVPTSGLKMWRTCRKVTFCWFKRLNNTCEELKERRKDRQWVKPQLDVWTEYGLTLQRQAGYLNQSDFEVWKSEVQMNAVNLAGWVLHTRAQNAPWNLVCYRLTPPPPTPSFLSESSANIIILLSSRLALTSSAPASFLSPRSRFQTLWNHLQAVFQNLQIKVKYEFYLCCSM